MIYYIKSIKDRMLKFYLIYAFPNKLDLKIIVKLLEYIRSAFLIYLSPRLLHAILIQFGEQQVRLSQFAGLRYLLLGAFLLAIVIDNVMNMLKDNGFVIRLRVIRVFAGSVYKFLVFCGSLYVLLRLLYALYTGSTMPYTLIGIYTLLSMLQEASRLYYMRKTKYTDKVKQFPGKGVKT